MIDHYLKVSVRNLLRNKLASLISVIGLAIALGGAFLVYAYVGWERSYNTHLTDTEHVYRVVRSTESSSGVSYSVRASGALARALQDTYPEVEESIRLYRRRIFVGTGETGDTALFCMADPTVFDFLDVDVIGSKGLALLNKPGAVLLSESFSRKLFNDKDPVGMTVELEENFRGSYTVAGVFRDFPQNTTLHFDALYVPGPSQDKEQKFGWSSWTPHGWLAVEVFIRLRPDTVIGRFEETIQQILGQHLPDVADNNAYHLQALERIYLHTWPDFGVPGLPAIDTVRYGDADRLVAAVLVSLMLLLVACANFVNLATARASLRQREVGVRKVVGAGRRDLVGQFLGEAALVTIAAILLGAGISYFALDAFRELAQSRVLLTTLTLTDGIILVGGAMLVGLSAGAYPAFYLSALSPVKAIVNQVESAGSGGTLRRALVTLQFVGSILLIAFTIVISTQIRFMRGQHLGFDSEQVIDMPLYEAANQTRYWGNYGNELKRQYREVGKRFTSHPNVTGATSTRFGLTHYFPVSVQSPDSDETGELPVEFMSVEESFLDFFDIRLLANQFLSHDAADRPSDGEFQWVVTETALNTLGFDTPEDAIGKRVRWSGLNRVGPPVGVIEDLRFGNLKRSTEPLVLVPGVWNFKLLYVRVKPDNFPQTLQHLKAMWKHYLPDRPFSLRFLDEEIDKLYRAEQGQQRLFSVFSGLAVAIGVMGVFGLAAFLAERRVKEICVRKILGARPLALLGLLLRDHIRLILIATMIAIPASVVLSRQWLDDYVTRIELSAWPFVCRPGFVSSLRLRRFHSTRAGRFGRIRRGI
jgi:putative ABC transport system permease protein